MRWSCLLLAVACSGSSPRQTPSAPPPLRPTPVTDAPPAKEGPATLEYLDRTLVTVARKYVDPTRFDYRKMLGGALDGMEREIAEVIAETANDKVTVRVNDQQNTFAGDVDSLSELSLRLTEIVHFVQQHANAATDRDEIELHAVNGMLRTLDPHTFILPAKELEEWNTNLSGKFGGIGIIIGMRQDRVTAIKVHPNTPAERGGMKSGDRIVAINGHSTEALTLDDAQGRLRGDPGTPLKLSLDRAGQKVEAQLTRAEIRLPVVTARLLDGKVGYVSLTHFDADTAVDMKRAMEQLRDQGAKAWVIDLRDNGGGYLTQAVRTADLFVEAGTIVATVAGGKKDDIKKATPGGVDTKSPVVVLVGTETASSAEILAGALKQLDRGILVGRTTFGKGSVQILDDAARGARLKITISEYVAANDISIQGVGIAPDVELTPAIVPKKLGGETDLVRLVPGKPFREVDLGAHLTTAHTTDHGKPLAALSYHRAPRAPDEEDDDDVMHDFEVVFAKNLALATRARNRTEFLRDVPKLVVKARKDADTAIVDAFKAINIDWTHETTRITPKLRPAFDATVSATTGEMLTLRGDITNTSGTTAYRVLARSVSDDAALDGIELAFGKISPRGTRQASATFKLPKSSAARLSTIKWEITGGTATAAVQQQVSIKGMTYPAFTYTTQLADGNDGVARRGESIRVKLHVTNRGIGKATKAVATLKSASGERVLVDRGRVELGELGPNQSKDVEFVFSTKADVDLEKVGLELTVADQVLNVPQTQKLEVVFGTKVADDKTELTPPKIQLDDVPLETTADTIRLSGSADDETIVRDVVVETSNRAAKLDLRKIFYTSGKKAKLDFATDVPLAPGPNRIIITAREHDKSQTFKSVWVYRR